MTILLRAEELFPEAFADNPSDEPGSGLCLSADLAEVRKLWCKILIICLYDKVCSVHYHSWKHPCDLFDVTGGTIRVFAELPSHVSGAIFPAARTLFATPATSVPTEGHGWSGKVGATCSSIQFDVQGKVSIWDAAVWLSGDRCDVKQFRNF